MADANNFHAFRTLVVVLGLWGVPLFGAGPALADSGADAAVADSGDVNTGQDITRPLTRVDLRLSYQLTPNERNSTTFILRTDKPYVLGDGWTLALRGDLVHLAR